MKEIILTRGKVTLVDDEDFEWLSRWKWQAIFPGLYARRSDGTYMHRAIMEHYGKVGDSPLVDHADRDGLNNQKSNLRMVTHGQSQANTGRPKNNTSGYKGVTFRNDKARERRWSARLFKNGQRIYIGDFATAAQAGLAYDMAALKHNGEFAVLNFPEEGGVG